MTIPAPFIVSRVLQAPRDLVFAAYTQAPHLENWLSPAGFHTIKAEMDFRVGGSYHYGIEGPNALQMWGKQAYLEIVENERLVHLQSFSTPEGGLSAHPMAPTWPKYMHVTTTFADAPDHSTLLTIVWVPHESDEIGHQTFDMARAGMQAGWAGTFLKLEAYLQTLQS